MFRLHAAEPEFELPSCYKHTPQRLQPGYLTKFKDETLFFIFYSMPGDEAQLIAADELSTRGWIFHRRLRMWFMPTPAPPPQKTGRGERGNFVVFNPAGAPRGPPELLRAGAAALRGSGASGQLGALRPARRAHGARSLLVVALLLVMRRSVGL